MINTDIVTSHSLKWNNVIFHSNFSSFSYIFIHTHIGGVSSEGEFLWERGEQIWVIWSYMMSGLEVGGYVNT